MAKLSFARAIRFLHELNHEGAGKPAGGNLILRLGEGTISWKMKGIRDGASPMPVICWWVSAAFQYRMGRVGHVNEQLGLRG